MSNISALAIIEDGAQIGKNVEIGANVFISSRATIGDGSKIAHGVCVYGKTTIGKNNNIFSYAVLGSIPQDLKYDGEDVELIIGDSNTIREFVLINPGTEGGGSKTVIGNSNLLMGYTHVAHDCKIGNSCILANVATLAGHVELGNNVVVGGMTPVHQFVKIGDFAMVAGASALSQDLPPYCMAEGNRAVLRGLNLTGLRRNLSRSSINALKKAYRELFEQGRPIQEVALQLLETEQPEEVIALAKFVKDTKRGIAYERRDK